VAGGLLVPTHPDRQGLVKRSALGLAGQSIDQPPVRRLAGQTLLEDPLAGPVPDGELHGRIVGQRVGVVLIGVPEGQGVEVLAEKLDLLVADAIRAARIVQAGGQVRGEAEPVIDLAKQPAAADPGACLPAGRSEVIRRANNSCAAIHSADDSSWLTIPSSWHGGHDERTEPRQRR